MSPEHIPPDDPRGRLGRAPSYPALEKARQPEAYPEALSWLEADTAGQPMQVREPEAPAYGDAEP